jgi:uncharacterized membrane protein (UPF0127 family)
MSPYFMNGGLRFAILDSGKGTEGAMRVVNRTRGTVVGERVRTASTFLSRFVGLLGTAAIAEGEGLWIVPCRGVHTLGMRYPIDVAFLDARGVVVGILEGLPPNRVGRVARDARGALELRAGTLAATGTAPGDRLEFEGGGSA